MATNISFQYHFNEGSLVRVDVMKNGNFFKCIGVDPDEYLAMHNQDFEETLKYLIRNDVKVKIANLSAEKRKELIHEAHAIRFPLDDYSAHKSINREEYFEDDDNFIYLWMTPEMPRKDKFKNVIPGGWVWIELPKTVDGVDYIPIIIHPTGGLTVHPYFHKYFLRAFDKKTRHHILAFLYVYGVYFIMGNHTLFRMGTRRIQKNKDDTTVSDAFETQAWYFDDSDAPKRINMGPPDIDEDNPMLGYDKRDYMKWLEKTRKAFENK